MKRLVAALAVSVARGQDGPRILTTPARARKPVDGGAPDASSPALPRLSAVAQRVLDHMRAAERDGSDEASRPSTPPDASSGERGGGGRSLLGRLELTGTVCPGRAAGDTGPCEAPPMLVPASGYRFNHAGAVQVILARLGANVRYTMGILGESDPPDPTRNSSGIDKNLGGGVVELRVDPPCPLNRFANKSRPTYCTFAPRQRTVVIKAQTMSRWEGNDDENSAITTATYTIWTGRHGRAMLVPYYHGEANVQSAAQRGIMRPDASPMSTAFRRETGLGYSGKMVEVQLNTMPFKTVHLHDVITDFAEFTQFLDKVYKTDTKTESDTVGLDVRDSADSDNQFMDGAFSTADAKVAHEFFVTAYGVEDKAPTGRWSRNLGTCPYKGQLKVLDLAEALAEESGWGGTGGNDLRGFWSGFESTSPTTGTSYGFLVPFFDGVAYSGLAVRVHLANFHDASDLAGRRAAVSLLNLTTVSPRARGFAKGFAHGGFAYLVPLFDGVRAGSLVVRVDVDDFTTATVETLDLADPEAAATSGEADDDANAASEVPRKSLAGFQGGQPYVDAAGDPHGLLVPYRNSFSPLHGTNSKLTADGFNALDVIREAEAYGGGHQAVHYASTLVRFGLAGPLSAAPVATLDLAAVDPDLRGFSDGVVVGSHLYLVPYRNKDSLLGDELFGYFGKVVRVDLESAFRAPHENGNGFRGVRVLDLAQVDASLVGFSAGFSWGKTLLLVPNRNAKGNEGVSGTFSSRQAQGANHMRRSQHGKVVGIDLTKDFGDLSSVRYLDLSTVTRQQIPKIPDPELRGFSGGFASGDYSYLVPYSNGVFFGKLVRIDMRDFEALADKQAKARAAVSDPLAIAFLCHCLAVAWDCELGADFRREASRSY